ncbi:U-box domain protein [Legionella drozanskii LLAP-1]|uniref:U-box domain protein n=1 Tax=Legionella drozanskii LLAP-1 TaxID=1212489 RepID=A0A0W0SLX1_9GAMM|nr:U-box domain protein [Legionella drozanskii LLAP-1]
MIQFPKELYLLFDLINFIEKKSSENEQKILYLLLYLILGIMAISLFQAVTTRSSLGFFRPQQENNDNLNLHEESLKNANYSDEVPEEFICPISLSIMVNPVMLVTEDLSASRLSFDKASIDAYMDKAKEMASANGKEITEFTCPATRLKFSGYVFNDCLKSSIERWVSETVTKSTHLAVANA